MPDSLPSLVEKYHSPPSTPALASDSVTAGLTASSIRPPDEAPLRIWGAGLSLREVSLLELENAITKTPDSFWIDTFQRNPAILELVQIRTCQRLEMFIVHESQFELDSAEVFDPVRPSVRTGADAVQHLFRVAGGLESVAVGEPEVREQLRRASGRVLSRHPRGILRTLIRRACDAAGSSSAPQASQSVAALAATKVLEEVGSPFPRVLIVGSGAVGQKVADRLAPFARITLAFRTRPPSETFLRETGARAVPIEALSEELRVSEAVITAAKTSGRLFGPDVVGVRTRPLLILDLGVPRNVDARVEGLPGVRLLDLSSLPRQDSAAPAYDRLRTRVDLEAERSWDDLQTELWEPAIAAWWTAVDRLRREECAQARPFLGQLTAAQQTAVDRLTQRLVRRILEPTTAKLRGLHRGASDEDVRQWVLHFVDPARSGP